jgi:hypothetical protein
MKTIYFGGGGWAGSFHIGVVKALEEKYGDELYEKFTFCGDSIGSYVAMFCTLKYKSDLAEKIYYEMVKIAKKNGIYGKISCYHDKIFKKILINKNIYKNLEEKNFKLGVSRCFNNYQLYSKWKNNDHLIHTLHSSFHIPFYCNFFDKLDGEFAFDGGATINSEILDKYDIIVGRGKGYDIYMNPSMNDIFFPPDEKKFKSMINDGYNKTINLDLDKIDKKNRKQNFITMKEQIFIHILVFSEIFLNKIYSFIPFNYLQIGP